MKIAVLISGGVDSTVALRLLQEQGHELTAFYLKIWLEDELSYLGQCPWEEDLSYVRAVCAQAGVPLEIVSLQQEYHDHIVNYTIAEIKAGRTPNPDVLCNSFIKFGFFLDKIDPNFEKVASGHYAQVEEKNGTFFLKTTPDTIKDQTYFLSQLRQDQLAKVLFPIGHLTKAQVREVAQIYDVPNKERKDSQGLCFLGKLKFNDFIKHYLGQQHGELREYETGKLLGHHKGFWYHTIGQRQGSGLAGGPWYVVTKQVETNTVYMSRAYHAADKIRDRFQVIACNWVTGIPPEKSHLKVKVRHGKMAYDACLELMTSDRGQVILAQQDQGLAPGQFAVFYDGEYCLGSGVIT